MKKSNNPVDMNIALDIHKVLVPKESQDEFFKFLTQEALVGPEELRKKEHLKEALEKGGERAPGSPRLEEEIEEEEKKKEEKEFRKTLKNLLGDQESISEIREEKASFQKKLEEKLREENVENPGKRARRIQARLKEDLKDWIKEQAKEINLNLGELRKAIKEYKSKTNGKVYLHSTVPKSLSGALSEVVGADGTIEKWEKKGLENSVAIEDRLKKAKEEKEKKNINMKIRPLEIPEKPQARLEEFGIEIKPESASDMIKELKKAEMLQEKLEGEKLRSRRKKETEQTKIDSSRIKEKKKRRKKK